MIIRILGFIIGLGFVTMTFFGLADLADPGTWFMLFGAVAFIVYGVGGQRWLAKIAPGWAKQPDKKSS